MVFTLHRYIFREVFRVFVLSTAALVLMMSLGIILRPVQQYGVGPKQVLHLMGYFLPITLTFVLPIAALFATSLTYGRLASDNEIDACRASGINLLTLVYPGLALAVMVAIANLLLSFHVMPAFFRRAEKSLKADAKQILFRNIQRRGFYRPPDAEYIIYADRANPNNDILSGVVVAESKDEKIERIVTAETAQVNFIPHQKTNEVQIVAHRTYQADSEGIWYFELLPITKEFPSLLRDDIKFKKIDEIKKIHADMIRFYPVEKLARQVYARLTAEILQQDIAGKIASSEESSYRLHSADKIIDLNAADCRVSADKRLELSGSVTVTEYSNAQQPARTLQCDKAYIYIEGDEFAPTLTLVLNNPSWQQPDASLRLAQRVIIRGLIIPKSITDKFVSTDILQTLSPESIDRALDGQTSEKLKALDDNLDKSLRKTLAEINAEIHSRLVFGIGCVPLTLIGIGLGIILKGGHLLTAFGASSIPAAALIVCIMAGRNITKNLGARAGSGIIIMWLALVLLFILTLFIYRRLLKN